MARLLDNQLTTGKIFVPEDVRKAKRMVEVGEWIDQSKRMRQWGRATALRSEWENLESILTLRYDYDEIDELSRKPGFDTMHIPKAEAE